MKKISISFSVLWGWGSYILLTSHPILLSNLKVLFSIFLSIKHEAPETGVTERKLQIVSECYSQFPNKHTGMIKFYRFCEPHSFLITGRRTLIQLPNDWKFSKDQFYYHQHDVNLTHIVIKLNVPVRLLEWWE